MKNDPERAQREHRLREGIALHAIEGNPLTPEEIAMFEMFEDKGWSPEQCRAYILDQIKSDAAIAAE